MCLRITFILSKWKCFYLKLSTPLIVQETTSRSQIKRLHTVEPVREEAAHLPTVIGACLCLPCPLSLKTWHCQGGHTFSTCGRDSLGHCDLWTAALPFFLLSFCGGLVSMGFVPSFSILHSVSLVELISSLLCVLTLYALHRQRVPWLERTTTSALVWGSWSP